MTRTRHASRRGTTRAQCRRVVLATTVTLCFLALLPLTTAKRGPRIPDNLDDITDDEEDEEFKRWGQPKGSDPDGMPGGGIPGMTQSGAQLVFARLTPDSEGKRTIEDVNVLASQWSTLLRSGGMSEQVYAVDVTTILMSIPDSRLMGEVREFLWLQPDVESFEWNSQMWMKGDKKPRARPPPRNLKKENGDKEKAEKRKRQKRLAKKRKREAKEGKGGGEEL